METRKAPPQLPPPRRRSYMPWNCACAPMFLSNANPSTTPHPHSPTRGHHPSHSAFSLLYLPFSTFYWITDISILKFCSFSHMKKILYSTSPSHNLSPHFYSLPCSKIPQKIETVHSTILFWKATTVRLLPPSFHKNYSFQDHPWPSHWQIQCSILSFNLTCFMSNNCYSRSSLLIGFQDPTVFCFLDCSFYPLLGPILY